MLVAAVCGLLVLPAAESQAETLVMLTRSASPDRLLTFDSSNPGTLTQRTLGGLER